MIKDPIIFLQHILDSINSIENFCKGISKEIFLKDEMRYNAIIRKLEIIGEATKNLSNDFRAKHDNLEWQKIAGLRDKLIHGYFGINLERIWNIIDNDLPELKKNIKDILEKEKKEQEGKKKISKK